MCDNDAGAIPESAPPPVEEGAPLWTVTFGDMMSLLLTFFILMFSMSELKMERFLLASQSLREAMGGTAETPIDDPMGLMPDPVDPDLHMQNPGKAPGASESGTEGITAGTSWIDAFAEAYLESIAGKLEAFVEEQQLQDRLSVQRTGDGVFLRIETLALFQPGSAAVGTEGVEILSRLSEILRTIPVTVVISGHADNQPIRTATFPSNWELSAARAGGVARILIDHGHDPELLKVEAWGEYRPVAPNDTPEGRALNRRVELFYARSEVMAKARELLAASAAVAEDEAEGGEAAEEGVAQGAEDRGTGPN